MHNPKQDSRIFLTAFCKIVHPAQDTVLVSSSKCKNLSKSKEMIPTTMKTPGKMLITSLRDSSKNPGIGLKLLHIAAT